MNFSIREMKKVNHTRSVERRLWKKDNSRRSVLFCTVLGRNEREKLSVWLSHERMILSLHLSISFIYAEFHLEEIRRRENVYENSGIVERQVSEFVSKWTVGIIFLLEEGILLQMLLFLLSVNILLIFATFLSVTWCTMYRKLSMRS